MRLLYRLKSGASVAVIVIACVFGGSLVAATGTVPGVDSAVPAMAWSGSCYFDKTTNTWFKQVPKGTPGAKLDSGLYWIESTPECTPVPVHVDTMPTGGASCALYNDGRPGGVVAWSADLRALVAPEGSTYSVTAHLEGAGSGLSLDKDLYNGPVGVQSTGAPATGSFNFSDHATGYAQVVIDTATVYDGNGKVIWTLPAPVYTGVTPLNCVTPHPVQPEQPAQPSQPSRPVKPRAVCVPLVAAGTVNIDTPVRTGYLQPYASPVTLSNTSNYTEIVDVQIRPEHGRLTFQDGRTKMKRMRFIIRAHQSLPAFKVRMSPTSGAANKNVTITVIATFTAVPPSGQHACHRTFVVVRDSGVTHEPPGHFVLEPRFRV